ncbi:MAG: GNAT family N-acetyltransferase, partial [Actinomycetota bacterium]|nr:GNAT family N-acetyltransferase [Actinomycetota bacterium]
FVHRLLPDGVRTEGHRFRWIEVVERRIGRLWSGPLPESSGDYYLFEIDIDEDERGQSLGREAIKVMIGELERENVGRFGLSVFDSNTAAVTLYESLGFETRRDVDGQREMWLNLRQPR